MVCVVCSVLCAYTGVKCVVVSCHVVLWCVVVYVIECGVSVREFSTLAQRKRVGLITQRSLDRNQQVLYFYSQWIVFYISRFRPLHLLLLLLEAFVHPPYYLSWSARTHVINFS